MKRKKKIKHIVLYAFLILYSVTTIFPFIWMVSSSFKSKGAMFALPPEWWPDMLFHAGMWANYTAVVIQYHFIRYLGNSTFISVCAAAGQVLTCSFAGFAFARMRFPGKNLIFAVLIATMMIPAEVTIIPEFLLFTKIHWTNTYLPLIIPSFLVGSFGTFMFKEFYQGVPESLEEAAAIDGCHPVRIYWHIFLPLSGPTAATLFIVAFMNNWNDILRPVLYIQSPALRTVSLGLAQFQSEYNSDWNLLLAASVITLLPLLMVYLGSQRYIVEGFMSSGIK